MSFEHLPKLVLVPALLILGIGAASAEPLAFSTRAVNYEVTTDVDLPKPVPVKQNGKVDLKFKTTKADQIVTIVFNTECGALSAAGGGWVTVSVLVDGVAAAPDSGTAFALCTADGPDYRWVGAVRQSIAVVPNVGNHKVRIVAQGVGVTAYWLGDISLVVQ